MKCCGAAGGIVGRCARHLREEGSLLGVLRCSDEGWTFVETIIVIAIILILTSTVGFMAFRYVDKAKVVAAKSQIENLVMALNTYYLDCQQYPTEQQGLSALWQKPVLAPVPQGWNGPYLDKPITTDPWGHPYKYEVPGPGGLPFGIVSFGADGVPGGTGKSQDVTSWQN